MIARGRVLIYVSVLHTSRSYDRAEIESHMLLVGPAYMVLQNIHRIGSRRFTSLTKGDTVSVHTAVRIIEPVVKHFSTAACRNHESVYEHAMLPIPVVRHHVRRTIR